MLLTPHTSSPTAPSGAPEGAQARTASADDWILLGGLDAALYQSGIVGTWLEKLPPPRAVFAGGMSVFNALLALANDPLAFRTGWERVRAAHVLATVALQRSPLGRLRNGNAEPSDLIRSLAPAAARTNATSLHILVGGGYVTVAPGDEQSMAPLIEESLTLVPSAGALAAAVDIAAAEGARRILVPGVEERRIGEREVARAIEDARANGAEVVFLPLSTRQRPGVIGYVLPGLGRADRLWRDGRRAALRSLEP